MVNEAYILIFRNQQRNYIYNSNIEEGLTLSTRIGKVPVISYRIGKVKVKVSDRN